jgi:hypothetical protein
MQSKISSTFDILFLFVHFFLVALGFELRASFLLGTLTASVILPTNMYFWCLIIVHIYAVTCDVSTPAYIG